MHIIIEKKCYLMIACTFKLIFSIETASSPCKLGLASACSVATTLQMHFSSIGVLNCSRFKRMDIPLRLFQFRI